MAKRKKKFTKKINPEKSNKMIYAVAGGLVLLLAVFLFFTLSGEKITNKKEAMDSSLEYLEKLTGLQELKKLPEENKVIIVYDGHDAETEKIDFLTIARYAGVKLSHKMGDLPVTVVLCKDSKENVECTYEYKGGRLLKQQMVK